jgi:cupin 2 domain-containing protein
MIKNLFDGPPQRLQDEHVELLAGGDGVRVERIVSDGQRSPDGFWYDQPEDEWVVLLCGSAGLRFEAEPVARTLRPGDCVTIPAHARHRVEWTAAHERTVWLAVHYHGLTRAPSAAPQP